MPFDLVIDEKTVDGHEARVSKTSVAGSWGAVAGTLRFFADRFGNPRAGIEGTTLSYDLIRRNAVLGSPRVVLGGPRKHQRLMIERRRSYFGFDLETEIETIEGRIPAEFGPAALDVLTQALMQGETTHPDQQRLRRALAELDELWRRSGGTVTALAPEALRRRIRRQLEGVSSWEDFLGTRLVLDSAELIDNRTREQLEALPRSLRLRGDAVPLDYEVEGGIGVARVRLREGQARRLRQDELPALDRPLRFAVQRGTHAPIQADTVADLQSALQRSPSPSNDDRGDQAEPRGWRGRGRRNGHPGQRGRNPRGRNPRGRHRH
jgi:hypothetical protein